MEVIEVIFIIIILALILGIITLIIYNSSLSKKIKENNSINQKIKNLNILQDFINIISEEITVEEKIKKINDTIIERYEIKYSTIVIYNGAEYEVKASNVDERHWETLKSLQNEDIFIESIQNASPKYITINKEEETLPYLTMEYGRAKSAMFFPIYFDNIYIGYWIIEGSKAHEFDNVDITMLEVIKNNIIAAIKTLGTQSTIENLIRDDEVSGLKTVEYLFGPSKRIINQYATSTVCLFKIINIEDINEDISGKVGNYIIKKTCESISDNLAEEYFFVRYIESKFALVFSGIDEDGVINFMKQIKSRVENIRVALNDGQTIGPKINIAITTYYKGTSLDGVIKKLEEYLDDANIDENNINCL